MDVALQLRDVADPFVQVRLIGRLRRRFERALEALARFAQPCTASAASPAAWL